MDGAAARLRREREMVWWGAMMPHMKRPPTLERFVAPPRKVERQSKEIMQAMCDALAAAWGAEKVMESQAVEPVIK
jgi:hypothetical protein